tara:strand:+ start:903 stop:1487 length:585 start_codon:yes stop_codon:yes gene_type:complete
MSTLKSSSDHLTINADGASKNILFQANGVQKASISSAGLLTSTTIDATVLTGALPAVPTFHSSGDTQAITTATATKKTLTSPTIDTDSGFDDTNNRYTPNTAGTYLVTAVAVYNAPSDATACNTYIYKNGSAVAGTELSNANGSNNITGVVSVLVAMNGSSDYVEMFVYHAHGSNRNILTGDARTYLQAVRVST